MATSFGYEAILRDAAQARLLSVRPKKRSMKFGLAIWFVMPGLVPGIHVLKALKQERRGWPGRSPAMTESESFSIC
jgi:hypothetical protein